MERYDSTADPRAELITELISHEHASALGATVEAMFMECLFKSDELVNGKPADGLEPVVAEGVMQTVGFHPARIAAARPRVVEVIKRMDDNFLKAKGGGWSFLNLCNDRDGRQWANLHRTMEQFVQLAIGCGLGGYLLPREVWPAMPGGMPYVWFEIPVDTQDTSAAASAGTT